MLLSAQIVELLTSVWLHRSIKVLRNLGDCLVRSKESLVTPVSGRILGMNGHIHPYLAHQ